MEKINLGIVGLGARGDVSIKTLLSMEDVSIKAVCDIYEDRCERAAENIIKAGQAAPFQTTDYTELINREDVDVVMVFTAWETHIEIVIDTMKAGKYVGLEVGGAETVEDCWKLVKTYEETKTPVMFLENCCYGKNEMLARNMVRDGLLGDVVHCHGAYRHDLRKQIVCGKENRHYRLNHYLTRNCDNYPTHDLGPIAKILDINRGNRMVRLVSVASSALGVERYIKDNEKDIVNRDLIGKKFNQGDVVNTIITCENGETISLKLETTLPTPYSRELSVHGTKGLFEENTYSVFIDGDKENEEGTHKYYGEVIGNAEKYEEKYLPDIWKNISKEQIELGHGGMDFFLFSAFFDAVRNNKPMPIDVYDAASWMCITALSAESIANGNKPVEIPDFTNGKWRNRERFDV